MINDRIPAEEQVTSEFMGMVDMPRLSSYPDLATLTKQLAETGRKSRDTDYFMDSDFEPSQSDLLSLRPIIDGIFEKCNGQASETAIELVTGVYSKVRGPYTRESAVKGLCYIAQKVGKADASKPSNAENRASGANLSSKVDITYQNPAGSYPLIDEIMSCENGQAVKIITDSLMMVYSNADGFWMKPVDPKTAEETRKKVIAALVYTIRKAEKT